MTNLLPDFIKEKVLVMPEYRQGTNKIRVLLKDGRKYIAVFVAWGSEIVKVGDSTDIPFDAADIVDVENDL
ncbi:MAG: hypothetical protein IPL29_16055 [Propionivibrio sp.]|nr:hypothetical protein [Propionivibrio sp.]